jgi:hypothetical protein
MLPVLSGLGRGRLSGRPFLSRSGNHSSLSNVPAPHNTTQRLSSRSLTTRALPPAGAPRLGLAQGVLRGAPLSYGLLSNDGLHRNKDLLAQVLTPDGRLSPPPIRRSFAPRRLPLRGAFVPALKRWNNPAPAVFRPQARFILPPSLSARSLPRGRAHTHAGLFASRKTLTTRLRLSSCPFVCRRCPNGQLTAR